MLVRLFISFFLTFSSINLLAQDDLITVDIGTAELQTQKIYFYTASSTQAATEALSVLKSDFSYYAKYFEVSSGPRLSSEEARLKGQDVLVEIAPGASPQSLVITGTKVFDNKNFMSHSVVLQGRNNRRQIHAVSDLMYQSLMQKPSMFLSKIFFVSDKTGSRKFPHKELYMSDFDGQNVVQLTFHKGTVISPAVSPDGKKVSYSLIRKKARNNKRNVELYLLDLETRNSRLISNRVGINSGAVFMPDGDGILLTLSHKGNAELFIIDLNGQIKRRVTKHGAADVDPSISVNGQLIAFLSDRPGAAMIYTLDLRNVKKPAKRISYVGKYNATPRFSPDGKEIVFSSWMDNKFDLFRISADAKGLHRLTKNFGSNEDPTFSPDGEFIAFTSQKVLSRSKATQTIHIMDRDGQILDFSIRGHGNCISPRWSK
jgi:TolB protein